MKKRWAMVEVKVNDPGCIKPTVWHVIVRSGKTAVARAMRKLSHQRLHKGDVIESAEVLDSELVV